MNSSHSVNLYNIECAVDNLNDLVFEVMGPLGFNEDPQNWRRQLEEYIAAWYGTRAQDGRNAIRAVAQKFVDTERTDNLLQRSTDLVHRVASLQGMLEAFDITSSPGLLLLQLGTPGLDDLDNHFPIFYDSLNAIVDKLSDWQKDCRAWQGVFFTLQTTEGTELLLSSMPATVPQDYLNQGRDLVDQMVAFWTVRKDVIAVANRQLDLFQLDDPEPLMERLDIQRDMLPRAVSSFTDLLKQLNDLPPLRIRAREYSARQLFEADKTFNRLSSQLVSIEQDICRLERIFDRFLTMFNAIAA